MQVEILCGANVEKGFKALNIPITITYIGDKYKVAEVDKHDIKQLENLSEADWKNDWGWYRYAKGSNMPSPYDIYVVNGQMLIAWDGSQREDLCDEWKNLSDDEKKEYNYSFKKYEDEYMPREYKTLTDYLSNELGASTKKNVCALTTDLAKANGTSIANLFKTFEGDDILHI